MSEFQKQAEDILKSEMTNAGLEINPKENGREGVDFIVRRESGKQSELYLQPMDLIALQSVKIPKEQLGKPNDNLWVALLGFIPETEPLVFLIPSKTLSKPDNFIFFDNDVGRHTYLSNWEIKVFINGMEKLGQYSFYNQVKNLK